LTFFPSHYLLILNRMNRHLYTDLLFHACTSYPDLPALHIKRDGSYTTWTFSEFHRDLNRLASALIKNGLGKGQTAAVIGENSPEWVIAFHAILLTGACTVPIDPNIPPAEIKSIISETEARIVFCSPMYGDLFRSLQAEHHSLKQIVVLDVSGEGKEPTLYRYLRDGDPGHEAFEGNFAPDDPMVIIFTSGTTGRAKGAVLSQKNYTAVANHAIPRMKLGPGDTVLSVLPLHHVFGFAAGVGGPLCGGMGVVFVPFLKGPLIIEALREKAVTMLPAVPKMISLFYESVMHNVKKKGPAVSAVFSVMLGCSAIMGNAFGDRCRRFLFSSVHNGFGGKLKLIISGGAALGRKYWNGFRLMGFNILEGYGLTETFGPITVCPAGDARLGSVGPALSENEIRIASPDRDGIGEVLLRGSCVFAGYYKNEALTKEVFDGEGWFHTGDLGRLDADGYLYLMGRKKDVIVLDTGKNVYPDELEDSYSFSPGIEEIGVFGVIKDGVEIVAAAIVPSKEIRKKCTVRQAGDLLHEELVRIGKGLPVHRRISDFVVVYQPLPRTTSRKLKKPELLKIYHSIKRKSVFENRPPREEQLSVMEMALMETDEYHGVVESIGRIAPGVDGRVINPRTHFEIDLGLDSLHRIELLSSIERTFTVTIPEDVFDKMETITDLVSLVKEQKLESRLTSVERVLDLKERILTIPHVLPALEQNRLGFLRRAVLSIADAVKPQAFFADPLSAECGPYLFVSFHRSASDALRILQALPRRIAETTFFLSEHIKYPWLPYVRYSRNMIEIKKVNDPLETIKVSLAVIRGRKNLISFPEGGVFPKGKPGGFKPGTGLVARETDAAIVPVCTTGKTLRFGRPFRVSSLLENGLLTRDASARHTTEYIRTEISDLL
jgi:long-chain acyl-CoA synthetase